MIVTPEKRVQLDTAFSKASAIIGAFVGNNIQVITQAILESNDRIVSMSPVNNFQAIKAYIISYVRNEIILSEKSVCADIIEACRNIVSDMPQELEVPPEEQDQDFLHSIIYPAIALELHSFERAKSLIEELTPTLTPFREQHGKQGGKDRLIYFQFYSYASKDHHVLIYGCLPHLAILSSYFDEGRDYNHYTLINTFNTLSSNLNSASVNEVAPSDRVDMLAWSCLVRRLDSVLPQHKRRTFTTLSSVGIPVDSFRRTYPLFKYVPAIENKYSALMSSVEDALKRGRE